MRIILPFVFAAALTITAGQSACAQAESAKALLGKARTALAQGNSQEALKLAGMAVAREPDNADVYLFRGSLYAELQQHAKAVADFDAVLRLDPKAADALDRRGSEHFKLGHIREAAADFDKYLELRPDKRPGHWRRG